MNQSYLKAAMGIALATASAAKAPAQANGPADPQVIAAKDLSPGGFHRHSEGSAVQLDSGRIILSWSRFYTTDTYSGRADNSPGTIVSAYSDDLGKTWSTPQPMPVGTVHPDGWNIMQAGFLKLDDKLQLYFSVRERYSNQHTGKFVIESGDGGQTWTSRRAVTPSDVSITGPNDRLIRTSAGRIILPVHRGTDGPRVAWSDDAGLTWGITQTLSYTDPVPPGTEKEAPKVHEPTVIERSDGSLYMLARTTRGQFAHGTSTDGGQTWTTLEPSGISAMTSPPYMRKLDDGRVLLLWNTMTDAEAQKFNNWWVPGYLKRHTLTGAISTDDARTWSAPFTVLNDGGTHAFHYPATLELAGSDDLLIFASRSETDINDSDLVMRRLDKFVLPGQQAGQAEASYDVRTQTLWLDVGSGVSRVEIVGLGGAAAELGMFGGVMPALVGDTAVYEAAGDLAFTKAVLGQLPSAYISDDLLVRWQQGDGTWHEASVTMVPEPMVTGAGVAAGLLLLARRRRLSST